MTHVRLKYAGFIVQVLLLVVACVLMWEVSLQLSLHATLYDKQLASGIVMEASYFVRILREVAGVAGWLAICFGVIAGVNVWVLWKMGRAVKD